MSKKKNTTFSIKLKLLLITLLPAAILSISLTCLAGVSIQSGMQEEALDGLRGVSIALQAIYNAADSGDYAMDEAGNVTKGSFVVSGNYEIVDWLKSSTGYEFTIFYGDTRIASTLVNSSTGERLVGTQASEQVIRTVLQEGEEFADTNIEINGVAYYGYYMPVTQNGSVVGMTFAGLSQTDEEAFIQERITTIVGISIAMLAVVLVIALLFSFNISSAVNNAEKAIKEVSNGNLKVTVAEKAKNRRDEIGAMSRELDFLITKLVSIITNVKNSSRVLLTSGTSLDEMATQSSTSTNEISHAVEDISRGAMTQAEETETASSSIANMGVIITDMVKSVDSLGHASLQMKNASDESTVIIQELSLSNDRTTVAVEKIGHQIEITNNSVQAIRQAVELITSIATETNLLSLNASIEAARAGEHGRGFAVVASEIQKLAEESNTSAQEIGRIIDTLLKESEQTVAVMHEVNEIVEEQRRKLDQTKEKFQAVASGVASTRQEAESIERQTASCDAARAKIMDVIQNLSAISEENAASTQETNASMEELDSNLTLLANSAKDLLELSAKLEQDMAFFRTE